MSDRPMYPNGGNLSVCELVCFDENLLIHNSDGAPAVVYNDGSEEYWEHGYIHREDGPAYIGMTIERWYNNGNLHRIDGPAVVYNGGTMWYINGTCIDKKIREITETMDIDLKNLTEDDMIIIRLTTGV